MARKKTASFWNNELIKSSRAEKRWRLRGEEIVSLYRNDSGLDTVGTRKTSTQAFNILFSNTQTIKPAVFSATPQPDVRPRYKVEPSQPGVPESEQGAERLNKASRQVSELLERALRFSIDEYDFDSNISKAVDDQLLPGRGVSRVRYVPTIEEVTETVEEESLDETGEPMMVEREETFDKIVAEQVLCEYVFWEDFRMGPSRNWDDVPWVAFRHKFTKEQVEEDFNLKDDQIAQLDFSFSVEDTDQNKTQNKSKRDKGDNLAIVWEIWDKNTRKVFWTSPGVRGFLDEEDDPLELTGFFPTPNPLYAIETTDTMTPVALYTIYEDLAKELNVVQLRIMALTDGLKLRGIYPNNMEDLAGMLTLGDNQMLGVKDFTPFEGRKISDFVMFAPIREIAEVIISLTNQREQIKQVIFEVTGISDILRGQTKASETLGAQQIKASFGAARLESILSGVRVFSRDILRMKAEIISEKFQTETLFLMTGIHVTEEMEAIMRSDVLRSFNIDIETDSTIAIDKAGEKEEMNELLTAIVTYLQGVGPIVASGVMSIDVAKDILLAAVSTFSNGRAVVEAIERIGEPQEQAPGQVPGQLPQGVAQIPQGGAGGL